MTEIVIKPITGEDIEGKLAVVQETVQLPYIAPVIEDWASLVVSKSILAPEDTSGMSDEYRLRKQEIHNRLDELISEQESEAVDLAYIGLFGDIGCCSLRYVLEQARRRTLDNPSQAKWPAQSMTKGLVLETAKTICLVESFNELLQVQPEGTVITTYQNAPQLAKSSVLENGDGLWSPPGYKKLIIPTYDTISRA